MRVLLKKYKNHDDYTLTIVTFAEELKHSKIINMIYYNRSLFHKNANKTFL